MLSINPAFSVKAWFTVRQVDTMLNPSHFKKDVSCKFDVAHSIYGDAFLFNCAIEGININPQCATIKWFLQPVWIFILFLFWSKWSNLQMLHRFQFQVTCILRNIVVQTPFYTKTVN